MNCWTTCGVSLTRRSQNDDIEIPVAPIVRELTGVDVYEPMEGETRWKKISCPWHEDRTPSASIRWLGFYCFSCEREGDAIKLLEKELGLDFLAAKSRAEEITGSKSRQSGRKRRRSSELLGYSRD